MVLDTAYMVMTTDGDFVGNSLFEAIGIASDYVDGPEPVDVIATIGSIRLSPDKIVELVIAYRAGETF